MRAPTATSMGSGDAFMGRGKSWSPWCCLAGSCRGGRCRGSRLTESQPRSAFVIQCRTGCKRESLITLKNPAQYGSLSPPEIAWPSLRPSGPLRHGPGLFPTAIGSRRAFRPDRTAFGLRPSDAIACRGWKAGVSRRRSRAGVAPSGRRNMDRPQDLGGRPCQEGNDGGRDWD